MAQWNTVWSIRVDDDEHHHSAGGDRTGISFQHSAVPESDSADGALFRAGHRTDHQ